MKKVIAVVLALVLGAGLAGCTGGTAADRSHSIIAETIEEVIPHLLNPVATYKSGVPAE